MTRTMGAAPLMEGSFQRRKPLGGQVLTRRASLAMPPRMSFESWMRIGARISTIADSSGWWLGDWLVYGQNRYPERYRQALQETSLDYQTLRNYAWVARKFPVARRRIALSLQHHAEVATLQEHEQDVWLDRAERERWSRNELRRNIKSFRSGSPDQPVEELDAIHLQVAQDRKELWENAAYRANCDLPEWMVTVLDSAAASLEDGSPEQS